MIRSRTLPVRALLAALIGAVALGCFRVSEAWAAPVYKDRERFEESEYGTRGMTRRGEARGPARPATRTNPGPGYVGSDWGLGKPSYWGIGPRPDWGYWSD